MDSPPKAGTALTVILILLAIAIAGCTNTANSMQGPVTPAGNPGIGNPATHGGTITTATVMPSPKNPASASQATTAALPETGSSDGTIHLDPIGTITNGEKYRITGSTTLPPGTDLVLQLRPDSGTAPTGFEKDSVGGAAGSPAWISAGNGTWNRFVIEGSLTQSPMTNPGRWVAVVGDLKGPLALGNFEMGSHTGYAYFTMR